MHHEHYQEIGTLLRIAREDAKLSLDQAAKRLHIRTRYLDALERGHLEELPGLPYVKGYLQSYAMLLHLDKDEILRRFEQVESLIEKKGFFFPEVLHSEKKPNSRLIWGALSAVLAIYCLWWITAKPSSSSVSVVETYVPGQEKTDDLEAVLSCVKQQERLYPACTARDSEEFSLLPISKRRASIMELAYSF